MKKWSAGLSLIELLIVISIIGILSAFLYANFSEASAKSRDIDRQSNLREIQSALELYKLKYGRYPAGCRGAGTWSGQTGTSYACPSGSQYIVGLAPEFVPSLPVDKKLNDMTSGYVYTVNTDGTVYKFMAKKTVESEVVSYVHEFKSCDATNSSTGMCDSTHPSNTKPNHCFEADSRFRTTYAVWGGYAYVAPTVSNQAILVERYTEDITCDIE